MGNICIARKSDSVVCKHCRNRINVDDLESSGTIVTTNLHLDAGGKYRGVGGGGGGGKFTNPCYGVKNSSVDDVISMNENEFVVDGGADGGADGADGVGDGVGDGGADGIGDSIVLWGQTTPFVAPVTGGIVIKVYDGDTITIAARLPYKESPLYRFSVRLDGIDTPEIKTKNESEKAIAIKARDSLRALIMNKQIDLQNVKQEKYGRLLATVVFNGTNINDWMIQERFAVAYDGGTKRSPDDWVVFNAG